MRRKTININHEARRTDDITVLLEAVKALVPAEYIFCYSEKFTGYVLNDLLIMVPVKQVRILNELVPLLNIVFSGQQKFSYRLFHVHEVKQALQKGSLFFDQLCKRENCLLNQSDDLFSCKSTADCLIPQRVKDSYVTELNKADGFLAGAKFYFKRQNLAHCAFMLHQFFDLTFRAIELLVMGAEKKTHRIQAHQNYIRLYLRCLSELFQPGDETDIYLLHLLDEAYLAVRYENTYQIKETEIKSLFEKAKLLAHLANQVFQHVLNGYFDKEVIKQL